jgi:hypothetical protein
MAAVYNWLISQMVEVPQSEGLQDVVIQITWARDITTIIDDKQYYARVTGMYSCPPPSGTDFTPYDELTFDQVVGWLEAGMDVAVIDENLDVQIENQVNPPSVTLPLPWETTTTTTTTELTTTTTTTTVLE